MSGALERIRSRARDIAGLAKVAELLEWDQQVCMPPGGAEDRAARMGLVHRIAHEMLIDPDLGKLLDDASAALPDDPDDVDVCLVRVLRRDHDRARRIPTSLAEEIARQAAIGQSAWEAARPRNDFAGFAPYLEKTFALGRQAADCLGYAQEPYDALLDHFEEGATAREIARIFEELKPRLVDLTRRIAESGVLPPVIAGPFPVDAQRRFTDEVVRSIGFDFRRGRQDVAAHPFCASFSTGDVRITTRFDDSSLEPALFASLHEAGHGLYEQGFAPDLAGTPLASGASSGIHESQSRLWENLVGRGRPFSGFLWARLREHFSGLDRDLSGEAFYRSVNRVEPSLIRVEADEVTYNLHVLLRFELERALLNGEMPVADLPSEWNRRMRDYLGIMPASDSEGALQDVHWGVGLIGYFPTYTLGNLMAAQFWAAARRSNPELDGQLSAGDTSALLQWLRDNVHRHGRKVPANALLTRATDRPLEAAPFLEYLTAKYSEIYRL